MSKRQPAKCQVPQHVDEKGPMECVYTPHFAYSGFRKRKDVMPGVRVPPKGHVCRVHLMCILDWTVYGSKVNFVMLEGNDER